MHGVMTALQKTFPPLRFSGVSGKSWDFCAPARAQTEVTRLPRAFWR